tara:strand:- start:2247 stop:3278 length:1032 start_codon:yes stop_codon:yes gene_type:complete
MIIKAIEKLINFENLSQLESENVMNQIMSGDSTPAQIGAYLIALRMKGETVNEITGSAKAMRSHSLKVTFEHSNDNLIDIVGTGGDGSNSFNISTATAFLVAATGRQVAKHGNRAASSKCGSADVLEAAGVVLELQPDQVAECIEKVGIGFMFAPIFHPAMKHAIIPRQDLKQRTIFNVLGPLTNPAGASHQLTGVYDAKLTEPIAEVLKELGCKSAMVIHSNDGLDELTISGLNKITHLKPDGNISSFDLVASDLGLESQPSETITGGSISKNLQILREILSGKSSNLLSNTVVLNAAAAMATIDGNIKNKIDEARTVLLSGAALNTLDKLVTISQKLSSNT